MIGFAGQSDGSLKSAASEVSEATSAQYNGNAIGTSSATTSSVRSQGRSARAVIAPPHSGGAQAHDVDEGQRKGDDEDHDRERGAVAESKVLEK